MDNGDIIRGFGHTLDPGIPFLCSRKSLVGHLSSVYLLTSLADLLSPPGGEDPTFDNLTSVLGFLALS